jgi:serine/threonine-protein kinase
MDVPAERRVALVNESCADDDDLRNEVASLLQAYESGKGFMEPPAMDSGPRGFAPTGQVGPYQVRELLGSGGMGEVYRAHDPRVGRDVALKVLPERYAVHPERLARFEREARVLATLNHPHVAALYGIEAFPGGRALVMELVEGETLAERLRAGSLPLSETVAVARQIAGALAVAHAHGIIHRDLKPANVVRRADGTVKVLDFGLAKALDQTDAGAPANITVDVGALLGTVAYMSPEQVRGARVDQRTDVWALGCVLYEMLTGHPAFHGSTQSDIIASVLGTTPDYARLPRDTPVELAHLIRGCLHKDQQRRVSDMSAVRAILEQGRADSIQNRAAPARGLVASLRSNRAVVAAAFVPMVVIAGWFLAGRSSAVPPGPVTYLSISSLELPVAGVFGRHVAISDDGSHVAYATGLRLWIRRMDQKEGLAVEGPAIGPFFSPDGGWVGFFNAGSQLKKVPVFGGAPVTIATTPGRPLGATWRTDGTIVFATTEGLFQVAEGGGPPVSLATPDRGRHELAYAWPESLPHSQFVLFTIVSDGSIADGRIAALDLKTRAIAGVLARGTAARYTTSGHLIYASAGTLAAVPFDATSRRPLGEPVTMPDLAVVTRTNGGADFAVSQTGTLLVIAPGASGAGLPRTLSWVDRRGRAEALALRPGPYTYARVSLDGTRIALDIGGANRDLWLLNLGRPGLTRITSTPGEDALPTWHRNGRLYFASQRNGNFDIYSQAGDGAAAARAEYVGPGDQMPNGFTPDGTRMIVNENFKDLSVLTMTDAPRLEPLLHSDFDEWLGEVSPDGRWIAYESNESGGKVEIFIRPFPDVTGRREKVSIDGGRYPLWNPNGAGELFYVDPTGAMMSAAATLSPTLNLGRVTKLFEWRPPVPMIGGRPYDVSPVDGRFLLKVGASDAPSGAVSQTLEIAVTLNWFEELRARVPGGD